MKIVKVLKSLYRCSGTNLINRYLRMRVYKLSLVTRGLHKNYTESPMIFTAIDLKPNYNIEVLKSEDFVFSDNIKSIDWDEDSKSYNVKLK